MGRGASPAHADAQRPAFLAPGSPHYEAITFGLSTGTEIALWVEGFTYDWRHVLLIPLRIQASLPSFLPFFGWGMSGGTQLGVGGFHGPAQRYSHFGLLGLQAAYYQGGGFPLPLGARGETYLAGLLLTAGYDFRWHYGRDNDRVWGLRLYAGWLATLWVRHEYPTCAPGELFCSTSAPRVVAPVVAGISFFIGLR